MLSRLSAVRCLPRTSAVRHLPCTLSVRYYTDGRTEGTVGQSKDFGKKGQADEAHYVKQHEMEQLAKLKAQINAKKEELDALEKKKKDIEEK